jgi:threonine dehydrogenase-like Zn-dependent dehydrogenase
MEAHTLGPTYRYEQAKQLLRLETDRPHALRQAIHPMPLDGGPRGYDLFKNKKDGCVRSVFQP